MRDDGSLDPAHAGALSDELAVALYEQMVLARELDERLVALQREGRIASHSSASAKRRPSSAPPPPCATRTGFSRLARVRRGPLARDAARGVRAPRVRHALGAPGKGRNAHDSSVLEGRAGRERQPARRARRSRTPSASPGRRACASDDVAALVYFGDGATSSGDFHTGLNFAGVTRAPSSPSAATTAGRRARRRRARRRAPASPSRRWRTACPACASTAATSSPCSSVVREARARAVAGRGRHAHRGGHPRRACDGESDEPWSRRIRSRACAATRGARPLRTPSADERLDAEVRADVERALAEAVDAGAARPGVAVRRRVRDRALAPARAARRARGRVAQAHGIERDRDADEHGPGDQRRAPPRDAARRPRRRPGRGRGQGRRRLPRHAGALRRVRRRPRHRHAALRGRHHRHRHRHGALRPGARPRDPVRRLHLSRPTTRSSASWPSSATAPAASTRRSWSSARPSAAASAAATTTRSRPSRSSSTSPGLKVVCPSNPHDAKGLLLASIRDPDPVLFFEPKRIYRAAKGEVPEGDYTVPLGKARGRPRGHAT